MLLLLLIIILAYGNFIKAKRKGKNPFVWAILTLVSFFCGGVVGAEIVMMLFYKGPINRTDSQEMAKNLMNFFNQNTAAVIFILLAAIGGYLLIQFILDRQPDIDKGGDDDRNSNQF